MKIGNKLVIMILALILSGIGVLLGTILYSSQKQITLLTENELKNLAGNEAAQLGLWLESSFSVARSLAQSMEAYEKIAPGERRFFYNLLLEQLAEANPEIAAFWTCWEPNALDGLDAQYANTPGTDETGRFIPYWLRTAEGVNLETLVDYTVSGDGDFYLIPLRTGNETVIEPYIYKVDGVDTLVTSLVVPVKKNGRVVGVAGIDISLEKIQSNLTAIKLYEGSIAAVFSNGGTVAGHFDPSRLGKPMSVTETDMAGDNLPALVRSVASGTPMAFSTIVAIGGTEARYDIFTTPIPVGETITPWALGIGVSHNVINAPVLRMFRLSIIISAIMLLVIGAAAFIVARSISNPLKYMMTIFTAVGEGDITQQLDILR